MISFASPDNQPQVAITMDDFNVYDTPALSGMARNRAILEALNQHNLKASIFVTGKYVDNETNIALLRLWNKEGHTIGNHTYSHWYYPDVSFQKYAEDILRNETLLKQLPRYRKYFRFPFLK